MTWKQRTYDTNTATYIYVATTNIFTYTAVNRYQDSVGDGIPDWWRAQYFGGNGTTTNALSCATCRPRPRRHEQLPGIYRRHESHERRIGIPNSKPHEQHGWFHHQFSIGVGAKLYFVFHDQSCGRHMGRRAITSNDSRRRWSGCAHRFHDRDQHPAVLPHRRPVTLKAKKDNDRHSQSAVLFHAVKLRLLPDRFSRTI